MSVNKKCLILFIVAITIMVGVTTMSFAAWYDIKGDVDIIANSGDWNNSAQHITFHAVEVDGEIIGYNLAGFNQSVAELDIPAVHEDMPVIGVASTFRGYAGLLRLKLPSSILTLAPLALSNMDNLTALTVGEQLISIGDSALSNCKKLTSVSLPITIKSIGQLALSYCDSMTSINIAAAKADVNLAANAMVFKQGQVVTIKWGGAL